MELSRKWSRKMKIPSCTELSQKMLRFFIYKGIFDFAIIPYLLVPLRYCAVQSYCTVQYGASAVSRVLWGARNELVSLIFSWSNVIRVVADVPCGKQMIETLIWHWSPCISINHVSILLATNFDLTVCHCMSFFLIGHKLHGQSRNSDLRKHTHHVHAATTHIVETFCVTNAINRTHVLWPPHTLVKFTTHSWRSGIYVFDNKHMCQSSNIAPY